MNAPRFVFQRLGAAMVCAALALSSQLQAAPEKATVSGKFLGDGKDARIQYVLVETREPFSDKPAIRLIFTEKDPAKSKRPDFDAGFKKLGGALILSAFRDGDVFGCEVAHTAHPKSPFSAVGQIKIKDFKVTDTEVSGLVTTGGELDAFGQKWEVELTFSAPLPKGAFAAAAGAPAAEVKKPGKSAAPAEPAEPTVKIPVAELPLPAGALDVEYKTVVEQIAFRSDTSARAVADDFAAKLKQKGWKEASGSLTGKTNSILKRQLNGAELTIMVQPAGTGSTVKIFAKGLDWSNPPASSPAKPAASPAADGVEAEANRLINEALKQIPRSR